ncbi:hypothetical protein CC86DRAFT_9333 [Ophiobolus disseminans]|uniref:Peptide N-acetyl-beta-D-glucosaminyl asparaginase amidase A N-terminal domain-containing protein n=1 Tax=Ophiobolus disseminans TaxID=1469910 RepID=A0A6A7AJL0_9PLEO|nr:hypothetical protein CC86DRAFT_9333 [Ophiobolus disseminans]
MYFQEQKSGPMLTEIWVPLFIMLISISPSIFALLVVPPQSFPSIQSLSGRAAENSSLLQCLQVAPPTLSPGQDCQQTLMVHTFAFSYGQPFVGTYYPPACDFNRVVFNFTVTSAGRQFDRLALMYFDDVEIFRTSTAEPTRTGIIWRYAKDMSAYLALFRKPQKIVFDLGNLVDDTYTGKWNTTLTATFFNADNAIEPADVIIPISAQRSAANQSSAFIVPQSKAIDNLKLPQNAHKAVFTISACGQAEEEFWWSNVLSSGTGAFGNETTLYGHSPFRELQLFIDGHMAGVAWPFPVIFTGGIVPGFWRPIVGIDAFDLREDEIDISPFLPLLCDDKPHTFEIRVIGIDDDGRGNGKFTEGIGSNWVVTGKVFVWVDQGLNITTGTAIVTHAPEPSLQLYSTTRKGANGSVDTLDYSIQVSREISIDSIIYTSTGPKELFWRQNLTFSNAGSLRNQGNDQIMHQTTLGTARSSSGYDRSFEYPLWVISSYNAPSGGNLTIEAEMGRGKYAQQLGDLAFPNDWKTLDRLHAMANSSFLGSNTNNWQNGTASYLSVPAQKKSYGSGSTEQLFALSGTVKQQDTTVGAGAADQRTEELYRRHIIAANDSVVYDDESYGAQKVGRNRLLFPSQSTREDGVHEFAGSGVRAFLGRGPY